MVGKALPNGNLRRGVVKLEVNSSAIDDVYKGKVVSFTVGSHVEKRIIVSYDAKTRVVTLDSPLPFNKTDNISYVIDSGYVNKSLFNLGASSEVCFAEYIWGADNYRFDWLGIGPLQFSALTDEESLYRDTHEISNDNNVVQTYAEKMERRRFNIFDPEFGNILTQDSAKMMFRQVNNAIDQISLLMTNQETKIKKIHGYIDTLKRGEKISLADLAVRRDFTKV